MIRRFWTDNSGATSIEYAIIASFIFLIVVASVRTIGVNLSNKFKPISNNLT